jgi:hypothetical protein
MLTINDEAEMRVIDDLKEAVQRQLSRAARLRKEADEYITSAQAFGEQAVSRYILAGKSMAEAVKEVHSWQK